MGQSVNYATLKLGHMPKIVWIFKKIIILILGRAGGPKHAQTMPRLG